MKEPEKSSVRRSKVGEQCKSKHTSVIRALDLGRCGATLAINSEMVLGTMKNFQSVDELIEFTRTLVASEKFEAALELTETGMQLYPDAVAVAATRVRILRRMDRHEDALDFALSCPSGMRTTALLPMIVELGLEQGRWGEVSSIMSGIPGGISAALREFEHAAHFLRQRNRLSQHWTS
ncbi:hypothetical protein [Nioella sp.]|uniref:hypothetical protein n=1 Tax=Nioella sp. TaxID=1912091 RepID=UPI003A8BD8D8